MPSILLSRYLAAGFKHSTASAHAMTKKSQHAEHMIGSIFTDHIAGCLQHCNTHLQAMPVCFAKNSAACLPCCKDSSTAHLQHMQCDPEVTACRAYDRQHSHRPQSRAFFSLQCTAERNACLLCKAFCCMVCLLQILWHSTCSVTKTAQHAEHVKGNIDTGHKADKADTQHKQLNAQCMRTRVFKQSSAMYRTIKTLSRLQRTKICL